VVGGLGFCLVSLEGTAAPWQAYSKQGRYRP
jgi:hypothetical protein